MGVLERWSDAYEPMQLITSMLEHQPEDRPTALQVLNHPFFWSPEKRLAFLCDCSDHFEREPRGVVDDGYLGDSYHLSLLEGRAGEVIGTPFDFLAKLDRHFVDTLGRQRKYSGNRLLDLLRALRNKKNHYEDMPEDVKKRVGPLPGGYLNSWGRRFPRLLMACYEVVHEAGLQGNDRFKGYFSMGTDSL
jgi:serine/threonine-protein kinase/endoribonuclease IRE1